MKRLLRQVAADEGLQKCTNCGWILSSINIDLALRDYGLDPDSIATDLEADEIRHISLYCPSYWPSEDMCPGYTFLDRSKAAYWICR